MSERVTEGEQDGVVYLGKSGFKMKVGVNTPTPVPLPMSTARTPRPPSWPGSPPAPEEQPVQGLRLAKGTLAGLCLVAFSCGIISAVTIDRYWPTGRPECGAAASVAAVLPMPSPAQPAAAAPPELAEAEAAEPTPAPRAAVSTPPASRREVSARPAAAQGRSPARKRLAPAASGSDQLAPTGIWVDPFAQ